MNIYIYIYMLTQPISYLCTICIILNLYHIYAHTMSCYMNIWIICIHDLCNAYTQNDYLYFPLHIPPSLSLYLSMSLFLSLSLSMSLSFSMYICISLYSLSLSLYGWSLFEFGPGTFQILPNNDNCLCLKHDCPQNKKS